MARLSVRILVAVTIAAARASRAGSLYRLLGDPGDPNGDASSPTGWAPPEKPIAVRTGTRESRRAIMLSALRDRRDCELSQSVSCQALDALLPPDVV